MRMGFDKYQNDSLLAPRAKNPWNLRFNLFNTILMKIGLNSAYRIPLCKQETTVT